MSGFFTYPDHISKGASLKTFNMKALVPYQEELEQNFRAAYLIGSFIQENLSEEEEEELDLWIQQSDHHMQIFEDLTEDTMVDDYMRWYSGINTEQKLEEVKQRLQFRKPPGVRSFWRYAAAASIMILLGTGIYFWAFRNKQQPTLTDQPKLSDIAPGQLSATLILGDGTTINLANIKDTLISSEVRIENGIVIYNNAGSEPEYHEISIPRKGFYELVLPDGSKVWINSSSSIRFPSRFIGNERRVTVTGETYFEVAKDAAHPFIVTANGIDIKAVGTAFNINAYPNEAGLKITLTEGSINVSQLPKNELLVPGQQVLITGDQWVTSLVEISPVIAWTKNQFKLKSTTIDEVMRMMERWYDAKIIYKDNITDHFTGTISRNVPVSHVLKLLAATGEVHFEIAGDTIIVSR